MREILTTRHMVRCTTATTPFFKTIPVGSTFIIVSIAHTTYCLRTKSNILVKVIRYGCHCRARLRLRRGTYDSSFTVPPLVTVLLAAMAVPAKTLCWWRRIGLRVRVLALWEVIYFRPHQYCCPRDYHHDQCGCRDNHRACDHDVAHPGGRVSLGPQRRCLDSPVSTFPSVAYIAALPHALYLLLKYQRSIRWNVALCPTQWRGLVLSS